MQIVFGILGIIISIVSVIVALFFGHIILFDSIVLSIIAGLVSNGAFHIHPAFCLLITIAMFFFLFWLQHTKVGFWIIGVFMSLIWSLIFAGITYEVSKDDWIWTFVIFGLAMVIMIGLHLKSRATTADLIE